MTLTSMSRWKASAFHLSISAAIAIAVVTLMFALWYPQPYFTAMGGEALILILIGVDVVIGPLITLVVFDPKKKSLKFDLAVIALLQVGALAYGCHVMFTARPVYNVFVKDRFETMAANQVDEASQEKTQAVEFRSLPLTGPRVVAAREPDSQKEKTDILFSAINGGPDLANMPQYYVPYAQFRQDAARAAHPLADLARRQPDEAPAINAFVSAQGKPVDTLGFLPMKARNVDMSVIVDLKSGDVVGILPINPW